MAQMTWRTSDELLERVRRQAVDHGRSLNEWVTTVLDAASDPSSASSPAAELRERLARAGILSDVSQRSGPSTVDPDRLAAARAAAGRGTPLSDVVVANRR